MQGTMTVEDVARLRGEPVYSSDRDKIGTVDQIYLDVQTNEPQWLAVGTGVFSSRYTLVPLRGASFEQDGIVVPFTKDQVKNSPDAAPDAISQHLERELYAYYGMEHEGRQLHEGVVTQPPPSRLRRYDWEYGGRKL